MEDEAMDMELLWTEPRNEKHLDEFLLGGTILDHCNHQMENQFLSLNVKDGGEAADEETNIYIEDYIDPSVLGCFFPNGSFGHGRRGPRRTSQSARVIESSINILGSQEPSTSGGRKHVYCRKNNDHWTQDEVKLLVNGVSEFGVGKWKAVKIQYFTPSIRTPVHLKDKWKNLVKACKKENGRMLLPLEQSLIDRIIELDDNEPYPKQSNSAGLERPTSPNFPPVLPPARWSVVKTRTKRASMRAQIEEQQ